jgi:hypothetical protein
MKRYHFILIFILLLTACQTQPAPAPSVSPANTLVVATTKPVIVNTPAPPKATPSPTQPAVHSSSSDPSASNLVTVRDQPIVNNSLTINSITAAQAGWIVLYLDQKGSPSHYICYVPVPAGKSNQFVVPLGQSSNLFYKPDALSGRLIDAVLQAGTTAPGKPINENGKMAMARFTITAINNP